MRHTVKTITCAASVLMLALTGCGSDRVLSSRSTGLTGAGLFTTYRPHRSSERPVPLIHILFVDHAQRAPGNGSGTFLGGGALNKELMTFNYSYYEYDRGAEKHRVEARPVHVRNLQTLEADGQSFALTRGTVFVVHVERDGRLRAVQLPQFAEQLDLDPNSLLAHLKQQLPSDARLQEVPPQRL